MIDLLIALAIGGTILAAGFWTVRLLATPGPEEPDPEEVVPVFVGYVCRVCGMALTVTQAQDAEPEPPRHCREPMVLTGEG